MRTHTTRTATRLTLALALTGTLFAAGCGSEKAESGSGSKPSSQDTPSDTSSGTSSPSGGRAQQVADAWDGSEAAEAWREGYYPMGDAAPTPVNGFHSDDDKVAHMLENYVLRGELPTTAPEEGQVTWEEGGESLTLPLLDARQAYAALDRTDSPKDPQLTVTEAKLGEMTLVTSRGLATVPAWLFTLEGYDEPLKRVALKPSKLPKPPIGKIGGGPETRDGLRQLDRLVEVSGDGRSVIVRAFHGSCDDGPRVNVLETDGSVVLSASIAYVQHTLPCTMELRSEKVTVKLNRPLGDRILLDAFAGRPVPYEEAGWSSPSWS